MILHAPMCPRETGPLRRHTGPWLCWKQALLKVFGPQTLDRPSHPLQLWSQWLFRSSGSEAITQEIQTHMYSHDAVLTGPLRPTWRPRDLWYSMTRTKRDTRRNGDSQHPEHGVKHHGHRSLLAMGHTMQPGSKTIDFVVVKKKKTTKNQKPQKRTFNSRTQFYDTLNKNKRW